MSLYAKTCKNMRTRHENTNLHVWQPFDSLFGWKETGLLKVDSHHMKVWLVNTIYEVECMTGRLIYQNWQQQNRQINSVARQPILYGTNAMFWVLLTVYMTSFIQPVLSHPMTWMLIGLKHLFLPHFYHSSHHSIGAVTRTELAGSSVKATHLTVKVAR